MDIEKAMEIKKTSISKDIIEQAKAFETIKVAVDELLNYRQIGTVDECRTAREKQMPKDIEFYGDSEDGKMLCPNCDEDLWDLKECGFNNCPYCGQALKWGD